MMAATQVELEHDVPTAWPPGRSERNKGMPGPGLGDTMTQVASCDFPAASFLRQMRTPSRTQSKLGVSPANLFKSAKALKATPQGRRLGYHAPEQVANQEPPDSRPGVLTTTLRGGQSKPPCGPVPRPTGRGKSN